MQFEGLPKASGDSTVRRITNNQAKQHKAVYVSRNWQKGQRKQVSASCPPKHDKHFQRTISINLSRAISKHFSSIKCQLFCVHKNVRRHENKAMRAICYNGGNLPQAGNTKIRMSPKLQNTTNFPPKHVQPGLRQIAVMAGSPSKAFSGQLL